MWREYGRMARTETTLIRTILMTVFLFSVWLMEGRVTVRVTAFSLSKAMAVKLSVEMYTETPWVREIRDQDQLSKVLRPDSLGGGRRVAVPGTSGLWSWWWEWGGRRWGTWSCRTLPCCTRTGWSQCEGWGFSPPWSQWTGYLQPDSKKLLYFYFNQNFLMSLEF